MYESDWEKVKFQFARNGAIGCNLSKALVMMDPYNLLKANIHRDKFGTGGAFILMIGDQRDYHY